MASLVEPASFPASANQRRMYVLNRLSPDGVEYNVPVAIQLSGALSAARLQGALSALVARHSSLRTSFAIADGTIIQTVQAPMCVPLDFERARGKEGVEAIKRRFVRPFELDCPPLIRACLIRLNRLKHVLLLDLHHIVCDGVSIDILSEELSRLYDGDMLPPLPADYTDFALWQEKFAGSGQAEQQREYWLQLLDGERLALNLPTDFPRPAARSFDGDRVSARPNPQLAAALRALAARSRVSMYMLLLAAYYVVLAKYTGQDDIVVGTLAAGRNAEQFQGVVGLFVNTLALRSRPCGDLPFTDYLEQVRDECLMAFENQDCQFEDLVDRIAPPRDLGRSPLFDTMFTALSANSVRTVGGGIEFSRYELDYEIAKFDLTLTAIERQDGDLELEFEFCSDLFRRDTIERLSTHYLTALEVVATEPDIRLREIDVSSAEERRAAARGSPQATGTMQSVVELFERQARTIPAAAAISFGGETVDYATLDGRANAIAARLHATGVSRGSIVGLVALPSVEAIAAILGILKLGAAFLPIDPITPADRFRSIASASGMSVVLLPSAAHPFAGLGPAHLALDPAATEAHERLPKLAPISGGDLAYVIYTSGSTGAPKGVMISHRALSNYVTWAVRTYAGDTPTAFALHSPLSVDLTITSVFAPLVSGNRIVVYRNDDAMALMRDILRDDQVEALKLTPTHLALLAEALRDGAPANTRLRTLIVGGEDFKTGLAAKVHAGLGGRVGLYNEYGPTEATVGCMIYKFDPMVDTASSVPIGRAIDNAAVFVLDRYGLPAPRGAIGELHIAGACLADGYLNNPDMTAERFVVRRLGGREIRVYRTGDLARVLPSGDLDFLGRNDDQVKLRGFRIELGEIEAALLRDPEVTDAAVTRRVDPAGDPYLCAYVVATGAVEAADFRRRLGQYLPPHMVPSRVVAVDRLPIGRSGKVDRTALPDPGEPPGGSRSSATPRSAVELAIAAIWEQVLGVPRIGLDDDFFDLGGQSLKATLMIARVNRELRAGVALRDVFVHRTIRGLAGLVDGTREDPWAEIGQVGPREHHLVSAAQKRLFIVHQLAPRDVQYNVPFALNVAGPFDRQRWQHAFCALIARHESLRTSFVLVDDEIVQKTHADVDFTFEDRAPGAPVRLAQAAEGFVRPFDLGRAPLIRATILEVGPVEHTILIDVHHIVADGLSIEILVDDLRALYEGRTPEAPVVQYKDYAAWQRARSASADVRAQQAYWRAVFQGEVPVLALPTDFPRGPVRSFEGDLVRFTVNPALAERLRSVGRAAGATLFMTLLAAYTVLLSKYAGQDDIVVGIPVAGRRIAALQRVVGMFVNTLATRNRPRGELRFRDYLDTVKAHALDAYGNQEYQFEELVDTLEIERDLGRNPLFDTVFTTLDGGRTAFHADDVVVRVEEVPWKVAKFDLTLLAEERGDAIAFELEYCTGLFRRDTIERMARHFVHLLEQIASNPARKLRDLEPLTKDERRQILVEFNRSEASFPADQTVHGLIEEQADRTPDAPAVVYGAQTLTYGELNRHANQIARTLVGTGLAAEDVVGIVAEPSLEMMVGILAVLKAGGAFLPIDPDCPVDRARAMLADSQAKIVLFAGAEPWGETAPPTLDLRQPALYRGDDSNPGITTSSRSLAYVIYTSGTTGTPKGVMVEHAAVNNLCAWHIRTFALSSADRTTKYARFSFDASVWEILPSLQAGAALHIVPNEIRLDLARLARYFDDAGITVGFLPTQVCELFLQFDNRSLRLLLTGGDRLRRGGHGAYQLVNNYGPTESTVVATSGPVAADGPISIGKPIANTRVYLLDSADRLVPIGVPGELCIAGQGLARGYLGDPVRTAEKFVANPFEPGERLYRTGDVARWRPDGSLDYLGRTDSQVKIRGCRIEPREVEAAILAHDAVKDAVVVARENRNGDKQLYAYVVWRAATSLGDLKAHLGQRLPDFMRPTFFVTLDAIPLNARGKVDLAALPREDSDTAAAGEAPRTPAERRLVAIWRQVLDRARISIHDNFFAIGGDSLRATIMIAKANKALGTAVALGAVFDRPTIAALAVCFAAGLASETTTLVPAENRLHYATTPTQALLHAVCTARGGIEYNLPMAFQIGGGLDIARLERAFREVIDRHESLRTGFLAVDGRVVQYAVPNVGFAIERLSSCDEAEIGEVTRDFIRPFDLSLPPLIRAAVVPRGPGRHVLLIDMHHLVSDGTSMGLLLKEIAALYAGVQLPRPATTYKDFAEWLDGHLRSDRIRAHESYWRRILDAPPAPIRLDADFPREGRFAFAGSRINVTADAPLHGALRSLCAREDVTLYVLLLAAYNVLLSKYSGREDIVIGVPTVGRYLADVHDVVGMFVSTHVIRSRPRAERRFDEFLREVKAGVRGAVEHQEYQLWDLMVEHTVATGRPLFSAVFVVQDQAFTSIEIPGLEIEEIDPHYNIAKFDLTMGAVERPGRLDFELEYNTDLFRRSTATRIVGHYLRVLDQIVADPGRMLRQIEIVTPAEKDALLPAVRDEAPAGEDDASAVTVVTLFERQVRAAPDRIAVAHDGIAVSYRDLHRRAQQLGQRLAAEGAGPGTIVGLLVPPSVEMVSALLAIWATGAACVPLGTCDPPRRVAARLAETGVALLLCDRGAESNALPVPVVRLDDTIEADTAPLDRPADPDTLAVVGAAADRDGARMNVMIEHRSLLDRAHWFIDRFAVGETDQTVMYGDLTSGAALLTLVSTLCAGGAVWIAPDEARWCATTLLEGLRFRGVTVAWLPAALCERLAVATDLPLRTLITTGGAASPLRRSGYEFVTCFGLPEHIDVTTCTPVTAATAENLVGPPIADALAYIIGHDDSLLPVGVTGELCLGGSGLARGYLGDKGTTSRRFTPNPHVPGTRIFRSGLRARRLADGGIELMDRVDVHIDGCRVHLAEIECRLREHANITDAAVVHGHGDRRQPALCAFIVVKGALPGSAAALVRDLRRHLAEWLPAYMIPDAYVPVAALPRDETGRVAADMLPMPQRPPLSVADENADPSLVLAIRAMVEEFVGVPPIDATTDLRSVGMTSLAAVTLHARVAARFGVAPNLCQWLDAPSIASLSHHLSEALRGDRRNVPLTGETTPS